MQENIAARINHEYTFRAQNGLLITLIGPESAKHFIQNLDRRLIEYKGNIERLFISSNPKLTQELAQLIDEMKEKILVLLDFQR